MRSGGGGVVAGAVATAVSPALVLRRSFGTSSSSRLVPPFRPLVSQSPPHNLPFLPPLPGSHFPMARFHGLLTPPRAVLRFPGISGIPIRRLCTPRASPVSGPGSIDSPMMHSMETKIKEQLEADMVIVKDAYGDGRHVSISVVSKAFEGKSAVNRQRMVYKAIWEELQSTVHAVDEMITKTPEEAAAEK